VGTPAYMAPERFRGEQATRLSDQFAFCVSLYRAAYGAPPFPGESVDEIIESILEGEARSPGKSDAPAWLWPILRRGVAIAPAARFPSMGALLAAIEDRIPRADDLNPFAVRRERMKLAGLLSLVVMGFGGYVISHDAAQVLADRWAMVKLSMVSMTVVGSV